MTGNVSYLSDYESFDGGYVSFGQGGCKITRKGTIKNGKLEFENVYFVKDLKYNLFSISQICDNKNSVLFTDSECIMLGRDFKLLDNVNVLLRTPRQYNMYSINLNNIVPHIDLTCLIAKASADEYMLWHRRLGHLNFKTMNKLVRHNLFRGLLTKCFENDHNCTACLKGKQHKVSCKSKLVTSVTKPLHTLHMDLFSLNSISSISHKWYCLVVTDDFSRFTWTFFLKSKDETSDILKKFITEIENLKDLKVKIIRCDNGGEFRNKEMNDFYSQKRIKREFSNARTPQQNGVSEKRNRTLIEAARTMLADAKLPVTFWAKAVNTACYVQNRVLVNKSHNKTIYELFNGRSPTIGFLKPFGCHVMIINTLDNLGKFETKGDEGTKDGAGQEVKKDVSTLRYIVLPNWGHDDFLESSSSKSQDDCNTDVSESSGNLNPTTTSTNSSADHMETLTVETSIPTVSPPVPTACFTDSQKPSSKTRLVSKRVTNKEETPSLDNILTLSNQFEDILGVTTNLEESNGVEANVNNMETTITASPAPTLRIHRDHPKSQIIGVRPFGTKWVFKNKKDERGIVIRNKARLVAQGHTQKEGIDYDEVFTPVERIKAIRLFLAYASFMGFTVYQMDIKSVFLYGTIDKEVYVMQPPGLQDPEYLARVYKVEKAMYGLHQAPELEQAQHRLHPMVDFVAASPVRDEPASPVRDVSQGEACPTDSGFIADQDRATIAKSSNLPYDSAPRVTSPAAKEGSIQQTINELMTFCTSLQSDTEEVRLDEGEVAAERANDDTEEMATVRTTMDAATVLASGPAEVPTGSGSIPTAGPPAVQVPTGSDVVPIASPVFATATVVTPYKRRKGKEFMESAKKQKISEEVPEEVKSSDEVPEERIKEMMQLVPIEEVYVEALQVKHPIIDWKMADDLVRKIYNIANSPRQQGIPTASYKVPTAKRTSHCQRRKMPLLEEKRSHCQKDRTAIHVKKKLSVKDGSYAKLVPHFPP
uniref:Retrovirus-related Pol polyprotein from transposon TNT 1-94 n=1 Tax=Tanacetum cinerariifolium TaxID=118510 RepID=A0A699GR77_TANCI|nr:retrovirus-related Pol polyprotein from transposon TNT 1-94 [Tanacetum cinerariifolium]